MTKKLVVSFFLLMIMMFSSYNFTYSSASAKTDYNSDAPKIDVNVCDKALFGGTSKVPDPSGACKDREANTKTIQVQIADIVKSVNNFLFVLAPSIAVIAIIVGAFNILQNSITVGVAIIQWALIGMVIVLLSSALISLVVRIFVGV